MEAANVLASGWEKLRCIFGRQRCRRFWSVVFLPGDYARRIYIFWPGSACYPLAEGRSRKELVLRCNVYCLCSSNGHLLCGVYLLSNKSGRGQAYFDSIWPSDKRKRHCDWNDLCSSTLHSYLLFHYSLSAFPNQNWFDAHHVTSPFTQWMEYIEVLLQSFTCSAGPRWWFFRLEFCRASHTSVVRPPCSRSTLETTCESSFFLKLHSCGINLFELSGKKRFSIFNVHNPAVVGSDACRFDSGTFFTRMLENRPEPTPTKSERPGPRPEQTPFEPSRRLYGCFSMCHKNLEWFKQEKKAENIAQKWQSYYSSKHLLCKSRICWWSISHSSCVNVWNGHWLFVRFKKGVCLFYGASWSH